MEQKFPIESKCECNCHCRAGAVEFCGYCFSFHQRNAYSENKARRQKQQQQQQQQQQQILMKTPPRVPHNNKKIAVLVLTILINLCSKKW